ncbi:hypothetical protein [Proteus terrae]|uniref:hypothetical protein n=1 Tax=Proteus terrae TaxID=1574161 RepID=UPI0032DB6362
MIWSLAELPVMSPTQLQETPRQGKREHNKRLSIVRIMCAITNSYGFHEIQHH